MNLPLLPDSIRRHHPHGRGSRQQASAVLVVLVLLACLALFLLANSSALHHLSQELKQVDRQQMKKYSTGKP